jgi:hypothetical protein
VPEPLVPDEPLRTPVSSPPDPLAWPAWIAGQYNAERVKHSNPPITLDPRLAAMAQERSAVLAAVDLEVPPDSQLAKKLSEAGFPLERHDESFAAIESASDHVYMQMLKPSARMRIALSQRLSIGIGIAARPAGPSGRSSYDEVEYAVLP